MFTIETCQDTARILLIEDNEDHAWLMRHALESEWPNANLHHVINGLDAINHLNDSSVPTPHLVLLDLKLPGMSGHDLLAWLKIHSRWREIPVVVMSSSSAHEDRHLAYQHHANSYIVKPLFGDGFKSIAKELNHYWNQLNQPSGDKPIRFPSSSSSERWFG